MEGDFNDGSGGAGTEALSLPGANTRVGGLVYATTSGTILRLGGQVSEIHPDTLSSTLDLIIPTDSSTISDINITGRLTIPAGSENIQCSNIECVDISVDGTFHSITNLLVTGATAHTVGTGAGTLQETDFSNCRFATDADVTFNISLCSIRALNTGVGLGSMGSVVIVGSGNVMSDSFPQNTATVTLNINGFFNSFSNIIARDTNFLGLTSSAGNRFVNCSTGTIENLTGGSLGGVTGNQFDNCVINRFNNDGGSTTGFEKIRITNSRLTGFPGIPHRILGDGWRISNTSIGTRLQIDGDNNQLSNFEIELDGGRGTVIVNGANNQLTNGIILGTTDETGTLSRALTISTLAANTLVNNILLTASGLDSSGMNNQINNVQQLGGALGVGQTNTAAGTTIMTNSFFVDGGTGFALAAGTQTTACRFAVPVSAVASLTTIFSSNDNAGGGTPAGVTGGFNI
jgi:hypothetical protein